MQIDIVGPLKSPVYKFVLTGIDVFSKYLFAAPMTNASVDTVARELTKTFFTQLCTKKDTLGPGKCIYVQVNSRTHRPPRHPNRSCNAEIPTNHRTSKKIPWGTEKNSQNQY